MRSMINFRPSVLGGSVFNDTFLHRKDFNRLLKQSTEGYPVTDIYDDDDGNTVLEFALAGFSSDELDVEVNPEMRRLTVRGNSNGSDGHRRIAKRNFLKTYVNYDNLLNLNGVEANYENGLLRVVIPLQEEAQSFSVAIK